MIVVRLARGGAKKHPFYHIVVSDSRKRRDSGYLERLGYFNPFVAKKESPIFLNRDRFDYWISKGAKSSQRVSSLVSRLNNGKFDIKEETEIKLEKADDDAAKEQISAKAKDKSISATESTNTKKTTRVETKKLELSKSVDKKSSTESSATTETDKKGNNK